MVSHLMLPPHLDELAKQGVLFEEAYSPTTCLRPVPCDFPNGGSIQPKQVVSAIILRCPQNTKTLADYFTENGYDTAYIGKWHLASDGELEQAPTVDYTITAIPP